MFHVAPGVLLVAAASGFPNIAWTVAAAVPDTAFIGMGFTLLNRRLKSRAGQGAPR